MIFSLIAFINIEKQGRVGILDRYIAIEKAFDGYIYKYIII